MSYRGSCRGRHAVVPALVGDVRDLKLPALHRLVELRHEALALVVLEDTQMGVQHQCGHSNWHVRLRVSLSGFRNPRIGIANAHESLWSVTGTDIIKGSPIDDVAALQNSYWGRGTKSLCSLPSPWTLKEGQGSSGGVSMRGGDTTTAQRASTARKSGIMRHAASSTSSGGGSTASGSTVTGGSSSGGVSIFLPAFSVSIVSRLAVPRYGRASDELKLTHSSRRTR